MAGIIDGEGCIDVNGGVIRVTVSQKNGPFIHKLQKEWDGKAYRKADGVFNLSWHGTKIVSLLEAVLPYLRIKKDRAKIALKWAKKTGPSGIYTSPAIKEWRDSVRPLLKNR